MTSLEKQNKFKCNVIKINKSTRDMVQPSEHSNLKSQMTLAF